MAKKAKDKQVTHIEKEDLKARQAAINEAIKVREPEETASTLIGFSEEISIIAPLPYSFSITLIASLIAA